MAISPQFNTAVGILQSMNPLDAARIVGSDVDLRYFLEDNKLELTAQEIEELKSNFRG